jgi:hypothetical protein
MNIADSGAHGVVELGDGTFWWLWTASDTGPFVGSEEEAVAEAARMRQEFPDRTYEIRPMTEYGK